MHTATATSIQPSNRLTATSSIVSITRAEDKPVPSPARRWAVYKPPPWWTTVIAFLLSIAIHLAAVAALETGPDGLVARLWENRALAGANQAKISP